MAQSRTAFALDEAMAVYSPPDRKFFLAKRSPGQVTFNRLPEKEQEFFYKSRLKEIKTLLESGAISILSPTESRKFRAEHPDYILESKFVDRWKPTEEFTALAEDFDPSEFQEGEENAAAPKSRWCVVGWQDPMITSIERSAPTPLSSSVYLALQLSATRKWPIYIKDAKAAFTQALPTTRKQLLACTQPKDGLFPGCTADQLILLHTEVYGLVSGPSWWRRSLLEVLISDLGYQLNPFDKCVLTLPQEPDLPRPSSSTSSSAIETTSSTTFATKRATTTTTSSATNSKAEGKTRGVVVIQVDDLLESGDEEHRRRIKPVILKRKVLRKNAQEVVLNSEELTQFRAALATLNWVSREGRPDVAAAASVLASRFPHPTARDVFELNDVLHRLKTHRITLKIPVIAETDIRHFVISDSAHDPSGRTKPQHGWLQGITTPSLNRGLKAPVSLMMWRSRKLRRKAGNTLLCESIALSTSLGSLERQAAVWLSLTTSDFRAKQIVQESASELRGQATVIAEDCPGYVDPRAIAVVDAKSLYDGVHSEQPNGEDDRSALEMAVIQESLQALGGRIRWVPHNRNPADGLTKLLGAHMDPLLELLATNSFQLEDELGVLAQGKQGDHRLKSRA
ncbi:GIP [Symbiodinium pilosum]|uniref:GIP protein n=1 Tax=Symbiodinium pilosum TaxID=2952 RepID=A0A812T7L7_SYMPI|nr:GIP [Symbiodinium pilosum]